MNQESRHFFVQAPAGRARLARRGFDADDHVAEKFPALVAVIPFQQRKRQHVGCRWLATMLGIQRRDFVVRRQRNREFRIGVANLPKRADRARAEQAGVDAGELSRSRRQRESNRHPSFESVTLPAAGWLGAAAARPFSEAAA